MATSTPPSPLPILFHILQSHTRTPEEGYQVLQVYQMFVDYASQYRTDPFVAPLNDTGIPEEWRDLRSWLHTQHPDTNTLEELPSHHDVAVELICNIPEGDAPTLARIGKDYVYYIGEQSGSTLNTLEQYGGFEELLDYITKLQPRCGERIIEYEERIAIHRDPETYLTEALRKQIHAINPKKIKNTMAVLSEISVRAAAFLHFCDFTLTEDRVCHFCTTATIYARPIVQSLSARLLWL
ncbi:hypothetical protein J4E91_009837 [Alternaria rosae]|nr:hypothetical protein J4E91_009837 [Alternaria rosae]